MGRRRVARIAATTAALLLGTVDVQTAEQRELHPTERFECRSAVWRVYQSHQLGDSRSFEEAVPRSWIENRVRDEQKQSVALEREFGVTISAQDLESEV